ncbi:hypothetical protein Q7P37_009465 [Cladosporium fusiforme]
MAPDLENSLVTLASSGGLDRLKALLPGGHESLSEETVQHLLEAAARGANLDVLNFLLSHYPTVHLNEGIVRGSIYTRSISIFKALLDRDPSIINMRFDMRGTPLVIACQSQQNPEYLRFLLEAGADPNMDPDTSIFPLALVASFYTDPAAIGVLLQHGARPEGTGALAYAAMRGKEAMVLNLLEYGARPEAEANANPAGYYAMPSPLHVAISHGHDSIVRLLLQRGADPNTTDHRGLTAIEITKQMEIDGKDVSKMLEALGAARLS